MKIIPIDKYELMITTSGNTLLYHKCRSTYIVKRSYCIRCNTKVPDETITLIKLYCVDNGYNFNTI
jgi:hypothetical protein